MQSQIVAVGKALEYDMHIDWLTLSDENKCDTCRGYECNEKECTCSCHKKEILNGR